MSKQLIAAALSVLMVAQGAIAVGINNPTPARETRSDLSYLQELTDKSYLELLELTTLRPSERELEELRKLTKQERKAEQEKIKREEENLKEQLKHARKQLKKFNKEASRDTAEVAAQREDLHDRIQQLEKDIEGKKIERKQGVPVVFDNKLAKIDLLEKWPLEKRKIEDAIRSGSARQRRYGDVEDIGIRLVGEGQEEDIRAGEESVRQMEAFGVMPRRMIDPEVAIYVTKLAERIAGHSDLRIPVHVAVLDNDEINAFALPGGYLFVNRGLIEKAETESELAGVIAHEIAHAAARHSNRLMSKARLANLLSQVAQIGALVFTGGVASIGAYYLYQFGFSGLGMLINLRLLGVSREYESEADQLGVQYLWSAGYDPKGFVTFFDKMASENGYVRSASFFRTHPPFFERIVSTFSEIELLPPKDELQVDSAEFHQVQEWLKDYEENRKARDEYRPTLKQNSPR